jgi:hypothetical protein
LKRWVFRTSVRQEKARPGQPPASVVGVWTDSEWAEYRSEWRAWASTSRADWKRGRCSDEEYWGAEVWQGGGWAPSGSAAAPAVGASSSAARAPSASPAAEAWGSSRRSQSALSENLESHSLDVFAAIPWMCLQQPLFEVVLAFASLVGQSLLYVLLENGVVLLHAFCFFVSTSAPCKLARVCRGRYTC